MNRKSTATSTATSLKEFIELLISLKNDSALINYLRGFPEQCMFGKPFINEWFDGVQNNFPEQCSVRCEISDAVFDHVLEEYPDTGEISEKKIIKINQDTVQALLNESITAIVLFEKDEYGMPFPTVYFDLGDLIV